MAWPSRLITCLQAHAPGKEGGNTSQALQRAAAPAWTGGSMPLPQLLTWLHPKAAVHLHAGNWESCSPEIDKEEDTQRDVSP